MRRVDSVRLMLPQGRTLPEEAWRRRHRGILWLLWIHALLLPAYAVARGFSLPHGLLETGILPLTAALASRARVPRRIQALTASVGLLSSSAILVHLSGGLIEMHFHFFVMVTVVALYQDWLPFLTAIAYVFVHHGIFGALAPESVFNHPSAIAHPWAWAGVHAFFIAGISAVCLVSWHLHETALIRRQEAEERLREEARTVEILNDIGRALGAELELERLVQQVTDAATQLTRAEFGASFYNQVDDEGESYTLFTFSGKPDGDPPSFPGPAGTEVFGPRLGGESVIRLGDITQHPRYDRSPPFRGTPFGHLPVRSYLAVPVRSRRGGVVGGLFLGHPRPDQFTEMAERLAVGIAAHAAVAIDTARLYESERRARTAAETAQSRLTLLEEASRVLTSSLDLDVVVENLCRLMVPAVADRCFVDLVEADGSLRRLPVAAPDGPSTGSPGDDFLAQDILRAIRRGAPELIQASSGWRAPGLRAEHGFVSALVVPLRRRHQAFGAMTLVTLAPSGRVFQTEDVSLASEVASRVTVAVEHADRYAREHDVAETLQRGLLPDRLPEVPGLLTTARYLPGESDTAVGGDWYDVFELPSGDLAMAMGDVVGRGIAAASLMGQLRNALRAYALEGHEPSEVLRRLNRLLHDGVEADRMATLLYAVFDSGTGTLRVCRAGHPPPLLVGPDGTATFVEEGTGLPLGAWGTASYPEVLTAMAPGSTLVLYTDGLVEDRTLTLDAGLDRLRRAVSDGPADLDELCEHILDRGLEGRDRGDDVALLVMRWASIGDRLELTVPAHARVLRPLRSTLDRWLQARGANETESFEILVAVGEACANAIQHAGVTQFQVRAEGETDLVLSVTDGGDWRPPVALAGGQGLAIMERFMDRVDRRSGPAGTAVTMRRRLGQARVAEGTP